MLAESRQGTREAETERHAAEKNGGTTRRKNRIKRRRGLRLFREAVGGSKTRGPLLPSQTRDCVEGTESEIKTAEPEANVIQ